MKQKKKIKCVSSPVLSSTLVFHPLSRVEKKGEKGQSNKKGQQMEGGGEPELSHVTSVDRLTGTPPRAHTQKGEKTFDDSILLCRLSSFLLKTQKMFYGPFNFFCSKEIKYLHFLKKKSNRWTWFVKVKWDNINRSILGSQLGQATPPTIYFIKKIK